MKYFIINFFLIGFSLTATSQSDKIPDAQNINPNDTAYGCFYGDCENGQGAFTFNNGDQYVGNYKKGKKDGKRISRTIP